MPYQRPSSSAYCARELFNDSNRSASLVDCTRKKNFAWGVRVFCEWRHKWRTFRPPWPTLPGPGRQPLGGSISLKFLLETRLQSQSFDTLDDLLGFQVQKLWCKLVKIFDNVISSFRVILAHVAWPKAQPLGQSVLLKFLLETRLKSEFFEPLVNFWAFLGQKLWSKINKLINYLISQIFLLL